MPIRDFGRHKFTGRRIHNGEAIACFPFCYTDQIIAGATLQIAIFQHCPRRNHTNDFTLYNAFYTFRVFHLFTDPYFVSGTNGFGDIAFRRMKRHTAHRHFTQAAISGCEGNAQYTRAGFCIGTKHFIKISQTVKQ